MLLFLVTGLGGDDVGLKAFRTELEPAIEFELLSFADIDQPCAAIFDINATALNFTKMIMASAPVGPIRIAGYSIGGVLALETARCLTAAGRAPAFVGLFDTAALNQTGWRRSVFKRMRRLAHDGGPRQAALALILALDLAGLHPVSRWIVCALRKRLGAPRTEFLRIQFLIDLWRSVFSHYRIAAYDGRLTLFRANRSRPGLPPGDLGWGRHLSALTIVDFDGDHWTMLQPPSNRRNSATLLDALSTDQVS